MWVKYFYHLKKEQQHAIKEVIVPLFAIVESKIKQYIFVPEK
jgi:hypothetical protein